MTPRNEETNRKIRDERREQILTAALKVFATKGLAATKISDIAAAAELSHGLIYHYFASKDEIFTELAVYALDTSYNTMLHAARLPGTPLERLRAMTEAIVTHAYLEIGPYYFLISIEAFTSTAVPDQVKEKAAKQSSIFTDILVPLIKEGQRCGEVVEGDPMKLAVLYTSIIQGIALVKSFWPEETPVPTPDMLLRVFEVTNK